MLDFWRTLPRLALPGAMGLGLAYLATGFLPRPEPTLRPPEELRAHGLGYGEESPVRAIFERNVLHLESPPFTPPNSPPVPPTEPAAALAAIARSPLLSPEQRQAGQAAGDPLLSVAPQQKTQLSGGPSVLGLVHAPGAALPGQQAAQTDAPQAEISAFQLVGVIPGGARPVAMVQVNGRIHALHPNEQALGWTLAEVRAGQALFRRGQQSVWLSLAPVGQGTP